MALDDPAPAERIGVLLGRLHPITRLIIAAGVLHLCGDLLSGATNLLQYRDMVLTGSEASLAGCWPTSPMAWPTGFRSLAPPRRWSSWSVSGAR